MLKSITFIFFSVLLFSFTGPNNEIQKKIFRSGEFDVECYVSLKKINSFDEAKSYYWFKSGEVHTSKFGVGGFVLHKVYSKFYKSNQLAEQGEFSYGLKKGLWKTWYNNGGLKEVSEWNKGEKNGHYVSYDLKGNAIEKGHFKRGRKSGTWVNLVSKDTIVYKKGDVFVKEQNSEKGSLFKRWFKKKDEAKTEEGGHQTKKRKFKKDKTKSLTKKKKN